MTIGHGTSPSVCTIVAPIQNTSIASFGDLTWTDGVSRITLPGCRADTLQGELSPRGRIWTISIFDRRWRWKFPRVKGWYNVRLGNLAIKDGTEKTPQELAKMVLQALGETQYDVSEMPNNLRPEVRWDPAVRATDALNELCDATGCRVVPMFTRGVFSGVRICRMGFGSLLPTTNYEFDPGMDIADLPDQIGVLLGATVFEVHLPLDPVISTELFSNIQLDPESVFGTLETKSTGSLFHQYPKPKLKDIPTFDPERPPAPWKMWSPFPEILRTKMQNEIGTFLWTPAPQNLPVAMSNQTMKQFIYWTHGMQQKLREEALRYYQVRLPIVIPGIGTVNSHENYVLDHERAVVYEDKQTGVFKRAPAYVYGSYAVTPVVGGAGHPALLGGTSRIGGINSEAWFNKSLTRPVKPNDQLIYQGGYEINSESKIVRFEEHMFRANAKPEDYGDMIDNIYGEETIKVPPANVCWEPAALVLVTGIRVLNTDLSFLRYEKTRDLAPISGRRPFPRKEQHGAKLIDYENHEDIELRCVVKYKEADDYYKKWIEPTDIEALNLEDCSNNADYYMDAMAQKYQTKTPQRSVYLGFYPIALDGAVEQVTYTSSRESGAFTIATRHSEWTFGTLLPYNQRRQIEELRQFRQTGAKAVGAERDRWRKFMFVPSENGGVWGLAPPVK